jgi:[FeFe] hydrogenase H-cluster maturation GTPase HydF
MQTAPKSFRIHIGIFGRRNVGKSSLLNAVTRQDVSIVSDTAGTTTDPVEKPMELLPLGPVLFIDTAGVDDAGALGEKRVHKTRMVLDRTDLAVLVAEPDGWGDFEETLLDAFKERGLKHIIVFNKRDLAAPPMELVTRLRSEGSVVVSASAKMVGGAEELRRALLAQEPSALFSSRVIASDLVGPGRLAVLVVPIDKEAPKGRLILPQVQTIRDLLDGEAGCVVVTEKGLRGALKALNKPPALVVTDSQAFKEVAEATPQEVPMTSFSILMARFQGDLLEQVRGTLAINSLKDGDKVLIAEACTHHPIEDDIGTVKIPKWLEKRAGAELVFEHSRGHDFPDDLSPYALVIHCGNCMGNRSEMVSRVLRCKRQGVPITNYGLAIAYSLGILERALGPFPAALQAYQSALETSPPSGAR